MDLYEALKNGKSEDELIRLFSKDLAEAKEKIEVEKAAQRETEEKKRWREGCRNELAMALADYIGAVFGEDWIDEDTDGAIAELLEEFEKEVESSPYCDLLKELLSAAKKEEDNSKKTSPKKYETLTKPNISNITFFTDIADDDDDKIIRDFLKTLK